MSPGLDQPRQVAARADRTPVEPGRRHLTGLRRSRCTRTLSSDQRRHIDQRRTRQLLGYSILIGQPRGDISYDGGELTHEEIADPVPPNSIVLGYPAGMRATAKMEALFDFCRQGRLRL